MTFLASISLTLVLAAQAPVERVHIEGVVLDSVSGRPIPGATLVIPEIFGPRRDGDPYPPPVVRPIIRALAGPDGKFALDAPEAGPHEIYASNPGYEEWKITLSQEEEQRNTNVLFRLVPFARGGVITGRVLDNAGNPIVGTQVQLFQYRYSSHASLGGYSDQPELWNLDGIGGFGPRPSGGQTNDRGEYRFFDVPPGKYFLRAPSPIPLNHPLGSFGQPAPLSPLGAVFYPGVAGLTKAEQIEVRSGEELKLRDLVLAPSALQPIRVSGGRPVLHGGPAPPEPPSTFGLVDGVFAIRPDEPGDYTVCISVPMVIAVIVDGRAQRRVQDQGACRDVVYAGGAMSLDLTPTIPRRFLSGRALLEHPDGSPPSPLAGVVVGAVRRGRLENFSATSGPDGFFKSVSLVQEGTGTLSYLRAPDGYYVTNVRQGSRDALTEGILISDQDTNLDVRVAQSASAVHGRVVDSDGKLVDRATIVLVPQGSLALRADKEATHRITTTNLNGTFQIRNVIPGTYRAYAIAKIEEGSHLDATVFKPFDEQSTRVEVAKDAKVSVELRQIP